MSEQDSTEPRFRIEGTYLVQEVDRHTCGTGKDGHYGAHEPGCGLEPVVDLATLPGWESLRAEEAEVERLRRQHRVQAERITTLRTALDRAEAALERVRGARDTWKAELDSGAIRDEDARYCWTVAVNEVDTALQMKEKS